MHPPASFFVALSSSSFKSLRSSYNMLHLEIQCLQSTRSLKKKALQLNDVFDDISDNRLLRKRQNHFSLSSDNICEWLKLLSSSLKRNRFNNYIMRDIQDQQYRFSKMSKFKITSSITKDVSFYRSFSSQSLSTVIRFYIFIIASVFIIIETSVSLKSSSQSFTQTF